MTQPVHQHVNGRAPDDAAPAEPGSGAAEPGEPEPGPAEPGEPEPGAAARPGIVRARALLASLGPYAVAGGISLAVALWTFRPWAFGQAIMRPEGDSLAFHAWVQNTIEGGWYEIGERLSAPFVQNSHGYTVTDELVFFLVGKVFAPLTGGAGSAVAWWVTLGFPAAAITAVALARYLGLSRVASIVPATAFALLPDHFVRSTGHYALGTTWVIPVGVLAAVSLVHRPRVAGRRRVAFEVALGVGLACVSLTSAYYGVFTGILVAAAGAGALWARRRWADVGLTALRGAALGVPLVAAIMLDRLYAAVPLGYESVTMTRSLAEAETYAGKITAMLLPAPAHRVPYLQEIRRSYDATFAGFAEGPALGMLAALGFVGLVLWAVGSHWRPAGFTAHPVLSTLAGLTWVALFAYVVGGLGTLWALALDGGGMRVWSRMHIFIALLSLLAVGVTLDRLLRRALWRAGAVAVVLAVVLVDQTFPSLRPDPSAAQAVEMEVRDLTTRIAADAGADAAIYQYPNITFPTANRPTGPASAYDGFLPYLYSDQLRWSYGGLQGDPTADWQLDVADRPLLDKVALLGAAGFSGFLVDTTSLSGMPEELAEVTAALGQPLITSTSGRWSYYALSTGRPGCTAPATSTTGDLAVRPPLLYGGPGIENELVGLVNSEGDAALRILTVREGGWDDVTVSLTFDTAAPLRVRFPDGSAQEVPPGVSVVTWTGDVSEAETLLPIERTGGPGAYRVTTLDALVTPGADVTACLEALTAGDS